MFRSILRTSLIASRVVQIPRINTQVTISKTFTNSSINFAKKSKGKKNEVVEEETVEEGPSIDIDEVTDKFKLVIEKFTKHSNEVKLGKANPRIFDKLLVDSNEGEVPFTSVAQTSVKGRNFIITVFDPINSKHIINTILGSGLNLNAQVDPANNYTLKVPLPPVNTETKKESVKTLKETFEKYKHGSKSSLSSIRTDVKHKYQKQLKKKKPTDAQQKELDGFEKVHKQYNEKLGEILKAAEIAIMK